MDDPLFLPERQLCIGLFLPLDKEVFVGVLHFQLIRRVFTTEARNTLLYTRKLSYRYLKTYRFYNSLLRASDYTRLDYA